MQIRCKLGHQSLLSLGLHEALMPLARDTTGWMVEESNTPRVIYCCCESIFGVRTFRTVDSSYCTLLASCVAQCWNAGLSPANFHCPTLDLQLMGYHLSHNHNHNEVFIERPLHYWTAALNKWNRTYLCGRSIRYKPANQANSAFHPFGVDNWVVRFPEIYSNLSGNILYSLNIFGTAKSSGSQFL